ncbi:hypothetical protein BT63DRAFT_215969 [Microthyrium microscopicum]|uniref:Zn(2)-C6 fungal-type domain-containing protein n=1 Tax=Microthyrium microscopicum TaxID=703497 RepID=A0A6A6UIN2_9PEZI|nr:hypothetical protein BT63DRAFT_215969 [Microthyrium microscopicum]
MEPMETSPVPMPANGMSLRESFGDRKLPEITRKITACVACRKQKIKCNMRDGEPPCTRCKKRNLSCSINRSLQMLLEDDANWKTSITRKVNTLEAIIEKLRGGRNDSIQISHGQEQNGSPSSASEYDGNDKPSKPAKPSVVSPREHPHQPWKVVMDPESGPAIIPAACVEQSDDRASHARPSGVTRVGPDLIEQGIISHEQAQQLLGVYSDRLDHFLYKILLESRDVGSIRYNSSLLFAAICTVGSLHSTEHAHLYEPCYQAFLARCSAQMFLKDNRLDDIRGLLIGAFWLSEVSWNLAAAAVRLATQLSLHRSINSALKGELRGYQETRLYYLVFVCDRHFSISYGRPPMSGECDSIKAASKFLNSPYVIEEDSRLVSQVNIWCISGGVFETFGLDVETAVSLELLPKLRRFVIALDTWRADWHDQFSHHAHVGDYPSKGVGLHFHFAKLYLCSLAFRGITLPTSKLHPELEEFANAAIMSAEAILRTFINDTELRSYLNGLPLYFDTMIAFAMVFLLKVATKFSGIVRTGSAEIMVLVRNMASILRESAATMHRQHMLRYIAEGIDKIIQKCDEGPIVQPQSSMPESSQSQINADMAYPQISGDALYWVDNFDLLSSHADMSTEAWNFPLGFDTANDI